MEEIKEATQVINQDSVEEIEGQIIMAMEEETEGIETQEDQIIEIAQDLIEDSLSNIKSELKGPCHDTRE